MDEEHAQKLKQRRIDTKNAPRCAAKTAKGEKCKRPAGEGTHFCKAHDSKDEKKEEDEKEKSFWD